MALQETLKALADPIRREILNLLKGQHLPLISANGYLAGFVAGLVFRTNGVDPGGGRTNNMWLIWLLVWMGFALIGGAMELFRGKKGT